LVEWKLARGTGVLGENLPQNRFSPSQISHDLTRYQAQAATVGSRWPTAWATIWPIIAISWRTQIAKIWIIYNIDTEMIMDNAHVLRNWHSCDFDFQSIVIEVFFHFSGLTRCSCYHLVSVSVHTALHIILLSFILICKMIGPVT
jgi:hypothetical protein